MTRQPSRHPTELELEILKVLWREGPLSVGDVQEALAESRELAYTTVMTMMNIMVKKGYLKRSKQGRRFVYRTKAAEKATQRGILRDLVNRVFDGSTASVMVNLLETGELDPEELEQVRRIIDRIGREEGS